MTGISVFYILFLGMQENIKTSNSQISSEDLLSKKILSESKEDKGEK